MQYIMYAILGDVVSDDICYLGASAFLMDNALTFFMNAPVIHFVDYIKCYISPLTYRKCT